jgi:hypothetical protein
MGRKGGTRRYFSKEYKLSVVKRNIDIELAKLKNY